MARRDTWSAGALALLAVFALVESARLDVGTLVHPGPGLFPLLLAAALLLVAGALLIAARRASRAEEVEARAAEPRARAGKLLLILGALAVYVAVFERLGFALATVGLLTFLLAALARYRWPIALGAAALITLVTYLVFDT